MNGPFVGTRSYLITINTAPVVPPGAPVIGAITAGDSQLTVSFSPPASDGGGAILDYTATCNPGGHTATASASPIIVSGLSNGVVYTCSVSARNSAGSGVASATATATPQSGITLVAVQSRKAHGATGTFDLPIVSTEPIAGNVTVESRAIGAGHLIVFQFSTGVTSLGAVSVTGASGSSVGSATANTLGNEVVVTLTGIPDNSRATISITGVNSTLGASASIGFLVGDINNSRSVNATDISGIKARSGQSTNGTNYKFDLNASGGINATDIAAVKARSGLVLP